EISVASQHGCRPTSRRLSSRNKAAAGEKGSVMSQTAADTKPHLEVYKDLYEIGEIPPLGHVPSKMYAWAIRKERHGEPEKSFQIEVLPTWELDSHDVLVLVMAAGV